VNLPAPSDLPRIRRVREEHPEKLQQHHGSVGDCPVMVDECS